MLVEVDRADLADTYTRVLPEIGGDARGRSPVRAVANVESDRARVIPGVICFVPGTKK
jgi:hypothetical protein